ncbi:MarR family winged helix-turn-helix transcriptional regulator [Streptomyces sp. NPDC127072]|uniref:MarR family winged helix-turn-helix transcriptional regulator n=1 Tax=Streptomyces sp. NPDC127072 TaxID=3347129 RepID=UPI00365D493D
MTTSTPRANGRTIGLAHYASRALLEQVLSRTGTTFNESVALRALSDNGGTAARAWLVDRLTGALKIDESAADRTVTGMTDAGLLEPAGGQVTLTESGRELFEGVRKAGDEIAARLYAGLADEDLETAGRVLTLVTERADAELAAL